MDYNEPEYIQKRRAEEERIAADFHAKRHEPEYSAASAEWRKQKDEANCANEGLSSPCEAPRHLRLGLRERVHSQLQHMQKSAAESSRRRGLLLDLCELLEKYPDVARILELCDDLGFPGGIR